jgi:hypothetical protein
VGGVAHHARRCGHDVRWWPGPPYQDVDIWSRSPKTGMRGGIRVDNPTPRERHPEMDFGRVDALT